MAAKDAAERVERGAEMAVYQAGEIVRVKSLGVKGRVSHFRWSADTGFGTRDYVLTFKGNKFATFSEFDLERVEQRASTPAPKPQSDSTFVERNGVRVTFGGGREASGYVKRVTEKAVLLAFPGGDAWFPKKALIAQRANTFAVAVWFTIDASTWSALESGAPVERRTSTPPRTYPLAPRPAPRGPARNSPWRTELGISGARGGRIG